MERDWEFRTELVTSILFPSNIRIIKLRRVSGELCSVQSEDRWGRRSKMQETRTVSLTAMLS